MGEGRRESGVDQAVTDQAAGRKLTVPEAAEALVISADAVRSRIKRGTLATVREGGRVFVVLGAVDRPTDRALPTNPPSPDLLYQEMQERIRYLETQVEEEREARRRADTLLARLMDRMPELEAPSESPSAVPAEQPESATDEAGIAQEDPDQEALLEGNKQTAEVAKTLMIVGSGLLVGMAAVVGLLPAESRTSALLAFAFFWVLMAVFVGFFWMQRIAGATARAEGSSGVSLGREAFTCLISGLVLFAFYLAEASGRGPNEMPLYQEILLAVLIVGTLWRGPELTDAVRKLFGAVRRYIRRSAG